MTIRSIFLFPIKSIYFIRAHGSDQIPGGITQYALVNESLFLTPAAITQSKEDTWDHVSPNPAIQLQCTATIFPSAMVLSMELVAYHLTIGNDLPVQQ